MESPELERLYDVHAAGLFHYLMGFTRSEPDARDLIQEVFIKLARLPLGQAAWQNERAYLYRLAHNLALDWMRRSQVKSRLHERCREDAEGQVEDGTDPDAGEFANCLQAAFAELPDEQRTVAQLRLWEGLSFEEISETQGIPLNTAASRFRYALEKLRALLRPIYGELQ